MPSRILPAPEQLYQAVIRTTHHIRDARAIHRAIEHETHGQRTLWAQPRPRTLILRTTRPTAWAGFPHATSIHNRLAPGHHPAGTPVRWSLIANATRSRYPAGSRIPGQPAGRAPRVSIDQPDDALAWLHRRIGNALLLSDTTSAEQMAPARGGNGLLLTRWVFAGTATVTDPDHLARHLVDGVGRGAAFGCGLLLLEEET